MKNFRLPKILLLLLMGFSLLSAQDSTKLDNTYFVQVKKDTQDLIWEAITKEPESTRIIPVEPLYICTSTSNTACYSEVFSLLLRRTVDLEKRLKALEAWQQGLSDLAKEIRQPQEP